LYYLAVPLLVGLWPLLAGAVYLPRVEKELQDDLGHYNEGAASILSIWNLDPDRLNQAEAEQGTTEFSYGRAVERVANLCGIPAADCTYDAGGTSTRDQKPAQTARVSLDNIGIVQCARFISTIQSMWVDLHCDRVKLTKKKGMPDQWQVDLTFWYYY
jgi:hypothetical protein